MNQNTPIGNCLKLVSILAILTVPCLNAVEDKKTPQSQAFESIEKYLEGRDKATTLENSRVEKELLGKLYSGVVTVTDVAQGSEDRILIETHSGKMFFCVQDAKLKAKASQLRKKDKIKITARLEKFRMRSQIETGYYPKYVAEFTEVQSIEAQSNSETEPKK